MQPGQDAPRFKAPAFINGKIEELDFSNYRGHYVILLFYPEDFGAAVTTQLIQISQLKNASPEDCVVLAVSTDSVESHVAYAELITSKGGIKGTNIPLISDKNGEICRNYQVLHNAHHVAASSGFIIDREGEIVMMFYCDDNLAYDMAEPVRIVLAAIACDKEEAWDKLRGTGADWLPGNPLVQVNSVVIDHHIKRSISHGEFKDNIDSELPSKQQDDQLYPTPISPSPAPVKAKSPSPAPAKAKSPSPAPAKANPPSQAPAKAKSPSPAPAKAKYPSSAPAKAKSPSPAPAKAKSPSPAPKPPTKKQIDEDMISMCSATTAG